MKIGGNLFSLMIVYLSKKESSVLYQGCRSKCKEISLGSGKSSRQDQNFRSVQSNVAEPVNVFVDSGTQINIISSSMNKKITRVMLVEATSVTILSGVPGTNVLIHGVAKYTVEDIPVELCTHLVYAFAILDPKTLLAKQHDSWLDNDLKNYDKFVQLKKKNPGMKVLLGLGGWNDSRSNKYSELVAHPGHRHKFVKEVVKLLLHHGFDGLDLDWEYPGYEGNHTDKAGNYTIYLVEFDQTFRFVKLSINLKKDPGFTLQSRQGKCDKIRQERAHQLLSIWTGQTPAVCDFASTTAKKGAPAHKLVMGVPFYGRSWTLAGSNNLPGAAARGAGREGTYVKASGNMAFFECCLAHKKEGWTKVNGEGGPYLIKGDQWVGYDDVDAVVRKAEYAVSRGLAGVMVWDVATDDFGNYCGLGNNPLLTAIVTTLKKSEDKTGGGCEHGEPPPSSQPSLRIPPSEERTEGVRNLKDGKEDTTSHDRDTNIIDGIDATGKKSYLEKVNNDINTYNTTTDPPYPWLLWPFFRKSSQSEDSTVSPTPSSWPYTHSSTSSFSSPPNSQSSFSPFHFHSQSHPPSSPSSFNLKFTTTASPTFFVSSSATSSSAAAAAAVWFAECNALGFAADPVSCYTFYRCTNHYAYKFDCPGGLLWNQDQTTCDWPHSVQCILPLIKPNIHRFLPPKS
nr:probable chitinase 10 [Cherax quadricarinatus]